MNDLDNTARHTIKGGPPDHVAWLTPDLDDDLAYADWLDTEMIAYPGEPKRRCDTVAKLVSRSGEQAPWALVIEAEARPRPTILDRLLEYECRVFRRVRHGPRRRDRYQVAGVVIMLTGKQRRLRVKMRLPGTDVKLVWTARVVNLSQIEALGFLGRIERGELGRGLLPWVPLMKGGEAAEVIATWRRLADLEPDVDKRKEWAGLAQVFADRAGCGVAWRKTLEEVDMWKSATLEEARGQGEVKRAHAFILRLLRKRFNAEPSQELISKIEGETNLDTLTAWFDSIDEVESMDAMLKQISNGQPGTNGTHP